MSRKSDQDRRQQDFFGVPEPEPKAPPAKVPAPRSPPGPGQRRARKEPSPSEADGREDASVEQQLARLSPAEVRKLVADLPDDVLAQLVLATLRQLKRRLARVGRGASQAGTSVLERAARQLMAELGSQGGDEEF